MSATSLTRFASSARSTHDAFYERVAPRRAFFERTAGASAVTLNGFRSRLPGSYWLICLAVPRGTRGSFHLPACRSPGGWHS
jgi:hypothetical protein